MAENNHQINVVIPTAFLQRVTPTFVSGLVDKAYQIYETNKAKYSTLGEAESKLKALGGQAVNAEIPLVGKLSAYEPTLNKTLQQLDSFAVRQLDAIEGQVVDGKKIVNEKVIAPVEERLFKPAGEALQSTQKFVLEKIETPVSKALDITEYAVDRLLPVEGKQPAEKKVEGETSNAKAIRLKKKTLDKLQQLRPLTEERLKSMTHSVSLIEYAHKYLDQALDATEYAIDQVVPPEEGAEPKKAGEKNEISDKLRRLRSKTLHHATHPIATGSAVVSTSIKTVNTGIERAKSAAHDGLEFAKATAADPTKKAHELVDLGEKQYKDGVEYVSTFTAVKKGKEYAQQGYDLLPKPVKSAYDSVTAAADQAVQKAPSGHAVVEFAANKVQAGYDTIKPYLPSSLTGKAADTANDTKKQ